MGAACSSLWLSRPFCSSSIGKHVGVHTPQARFQDHLCRSTSWVSTCMQAVASTSASHLRAAVASGLPADACSHMMHTLLWLIASRMICAAHLHCCVHCSPWCVTPLVWGPVTRGGPGGGGAPTAGAGGGRGERRWQGESKGIRGAKGAGWLWQGPVAAAGSNRLATCSL